MGSQNIPWAAIAASLKNQADEEQRHQLKEWLDLSPENPVILSEVSKTWLLTKRQFMHYEPDEEANWNKLMKLIGYRGREVNMNNIFRWVAAAAILILVFLGGLGVGERASHISEPVSMIRVISPKGNKTQIVLPDSTHVWINSGSEIQYPSNYTAQNRRIYMKGECFFDVTKDPKNPFVVQSSKLRIKVFGTRFNVNESKSSDQTDVTLISGVVSVFNRKNELLSRLSPGEQLIYLKGSSRINRLSNPEAHTSWINDMLIFDNVPFEDVLDYLENWYGVSIQLDNTLKYKYNYTFKVKTESLREVFGLISYITPIHYEIEGDSVFVKYKPKIKK